MGDGDEFIEVIKASITYGISNKKTIIIYGVLYLILLALLFLGLILAILFYKNPFAWAFFGLTFVPLLIFSLLSMGYWIQCLRALLEGSDTMPDLFQDVPNMAIEGVKSHIVSFIMMAPALVLYLLAIGLMFAGVFYSLIFLAVGLVLVAVIMLALLPLMFIYLIQLVVYADTGSLSKGINPFVAIGLIRQNPNGAALVAGHTICLYAINVAVTTILSWTCIGYIFLPFAIVPLYAAILYVFVRFYRQTRSPGID